MKVLFILSSMRDPDGSRRGPADSNLHFVCFELSSRDVAHHGYYELVRILRRRVFIEELGVPHHAEFDEFEQSSRHMLGLLGDAPVSYARWHIQKSVAVIDRLCTLQGYRNRHVGRRCLESVLRDVLTSISRCHASIHGVTLLVPKSDNVLQQKLLSAHFVPLAEHCDCHIPSVQMAVSASALTSMGSHHD